VTVPRDDVTLLASLVNICIFKTPHLNCCLKEFDRQESKKVQELFDNIELMLFDDCVGGPSNLHNECREWTSTFPHLRYVALSNV
jgi:Protein of unknown function (DUF3719)